MANVLRVPEWLLERMAAGELSSERREALLARLREVGEEDRLRKLAESNAEILSALPPAQVVREIERRRASVVRGVRPVWTFSLATACVASLAVFVTVAVLHKPPSANRQSEEQIGLKGDPRTPVLRIYRKTGGKPDADVEMLRANAEVHKGDTLQIRYLAAGRRFGVIASLDGRGTITLHLPEAPGPAAPLARDGEHALAHAYELDDSPKFERFVFVTGDAPFTTDDVTASLRNSRALPAPLASYEIAVRKLP